MVVEPIVCSMVRGYPAVSAGALEVSLVAAGAPQAAVASRARPAAAAPKCLRMRVFTESLSNDVTGR
jgi:hypothetical protein